MRSLETDRLVLEPLRVAHAERMFELLGDSALYRYLDDAPPSSLDQLRQRYARLQSAGSADQSQRWLNWIIVPKGEAAAGFVQATVVANRMAWVAWLLSRDCWGRGYAAEATRAMLAHLAASHGVARCQATVEADNVRSIRLLKRLAFRRATPRELEGRPLSPTERLFVKDLE